MKQLEINKRELSSNTKLQIVAWSLSIGVVLLAFSAWSQTYNWNYSHLTSYQIFPIFGLLAFSIMWSHYVASVIRQFFKVNKSALVKYFNLTSYAVLIALLVHPGLLIIQRYIDGFGLPPKSYLSYEPNFLKWVVLLGTASFFIFMFYELRRFYSKKSWWVYAQAAVDLAMIAIFYHSLRLGDQLHGGWFRDLWIFYGVTLAGSLMYIYIKKFNAVGENK